MALSYGVVVCEEKLMLFGSMPVSWGIHMNWNPKILICLGKIEDDTVDKIQENNIL